MATSGRTLHRERQAALAVAGHVHREAGLVQAVRHELGKVLSSSTMRARMRRPAPDSSAARPQRVVQVCQARRSTRTDPTDLADPVDPPDRST